MVYRKAWEVQYQRDRARGLTRYVDAEPTRSVRGHEKVPTGGQVAVPAGGHDQSPVVAK